MVDSRASSEDSGLLEPKSLLYSINARIGGHGLDLNAHEGLKLSYARDFLGQALAYDNRQKDIPAEKIRSLRWTPVRFLSFLKSPFYYDAKKRYIDKVAARALESGRYDFFHGWENNSLHSLRVAKRKGIPSVLEIPTWHRDKGKIKPRDLVQISKIEREAKFPETLFKKILISRQETLEEYDLADLLLVRSECAAKTFTDVGFPREKLFMHGAAVDLANFPDARSEQPTAYSAARPLRFVYLGALIRRKGVHVLLEAWQKAALPHATLELVGSIHDEIKPALEKFKTDTIRITGFTKNPSSRLQEADVHVFPSECEGSAKTVCEACGAGLAQITTFESGDVVQSDVNGILIPPKNPDALAEALRELYNDPARVARYQSAARPRAEQNFTWDHFRQRLAKAYDLALRKKNP
ncbi:MAG: glycosyltransferase family 4 protein [Chthoniobacterales bacterium]